MLMCQVTSVYIVEYLSFAQLKIISDCVTRVRIVVASPACPPKRGPNAILHIFITGYEYVTKLVCIDGLFDKLVVHFGTPYFYMII